MENNSEFSRAFYSMALSVAHARQRAIERRTVNEIVQTVRQKVVTIKYEFLPSFYLEYLMTSRETSILIVTLDLPNMKDFDHKCPSDIREFGMK
jgi:hypothetical protein